MSTYDKMTSVEEVHGHHEFIETVGEYKWTLYNFSSFNEKNGKCICSPTFSNRVSDDNYYAKWRLDLFPNGDDENSKGYISVYLRPLTDVRIIVDCEFTISSNMKVYYNNKFSYLCKKNIARGYSHCIHRNTLLNDLNNESDTLIVVSKIIFSNNFYQTNFQLNLVKDIASLLKMGKHYDVILKSNDEVEYKAHKLLLICRSKVFSAMFQHNMKESQDNVVNIEDVDSETLKAMLQFVYPGEVKCMRNKAEKLLIAADKYELNDLRTMCVYHISENMTKYNILDWIEMAHTYNINELKLKAKKYFLQNRKIIMTTEGREKIKSLSRDILEDLLCDVSTYDETK